MKPFGPETVGGLRGFKGKIYEGGIRVPCVIEWPAVIKKARITEFPAVTMDIFPTIAEIVGLPQENMVQPIDGISILKVFKKRYREKKKTYSFQTYRKSCIYG